jgi:phenylacetate-CoA ligase
MTSPSPADALSRRVSSVLAERLPEHLARLDWDAGRLAAHQRDRLRTLLAHAVEHSPFHARRLKGVDVDRFELAGLARLPTMTKADMMDGFDTLVTDRRLERHVVERHLAASRVVPSLLLDEYVCLASGGSSALRGVFVQTAEEYAECVASTVRRGMARIAAEGGPTAGSATMALVAAAAPVHSSGLAAAVSRHGPVRIVAVPVTLPLSEIVERLNALRPASMMGYASTLALLAGEQLAGRLRIAPRSVTSSGEMLGDTERATITAGFGVPVINMFASTEGLLGHSEPGGSVVTFASDTCLVELVDDDRRPVAAGAPAAVALVTNLHNLTQPLIRYELTDRFVRHPDVAGCVRATVAGRADDVFRYGNVEVHPHVIRSALVSAPAVREYAVRQTERGADVSVVADGPVDNAALAGVLADGLRSAGVPNPEVSVRPVDGFLRHTETGKIRRFIPLGGGAG